LHGYISLGALKLFRLNNNDCCFSTDQVSIKLKKKNSSKQENQFKRTVWSTQIVKAINIEVTTHKLLSIPTT